MTRHPVCGKRGKVVSLVTLFAKVLCACPPRGRKLALPEAEPGPPLSCEVFYFLEVVSVTMRPRYTVRYVQSRLLARSVV